MVDKTQVVITPLYLKEFSCISTECTHSCCCGNWDVDIDEITYKKYKRLKYPLNKIVEQSVIRNRSHSSSEAFAKVKIRGRCPFLNAQGLCQMQLHYGEEYLSNVCALYPRMTNKIDGILEKSATVACPEIARLVLKNPAGIEYEMVEENSNDRSLINFSIDTSEKVWRKKAGEYILDIHTFSIQILKDRRYTLNNRMKRLGLFLKGIDQESKNGNYAGIPIIMELFSTEEDFAKQINPRPDLLAEVLLKFQWVQEFESFKGLSQGETLKAYLNAYQKNYLPFIQEHSYVIENYMVNYAFQTMFPMQQNKTFFESYLLLLVSYLMIQAQLVCIGSLYKEVNIDIAIEYLIQFSKIVEHRKNYREILVADLLKIIQPDSIESLSLILE